MPATAHQSTIKILYGESDEHTLSAQAAEIAKAGHHVTTALDRHGVTEINLLVLTHFDADHIGGLDGIWDLCLS